MKRDANSAGCDRARENLAELALGILPGRERSEILAHVGTCDLCSARLLQFTATADDLLLLAGEVEPPLGFEIRLANRMRSGATLQSLRERPALSYGRIRRFTFAAIILAFVGIGLGLYLTSRTPPASPWSTEATFKSTSAATLGRPIGEVFVASGTPDWILMSVNDKSLSGVVTCEVTLSNGAVERIGEFRVVGGYGTWGFPLNRAIRAISGARLLAQDGAVVARALLYR